MRRLIWLPIAGFLLIAGATIAAAAPSITPTSNNVLKAASSASAADAIQNPVTGDQQAGHPGMGDDLLNQVLTDLVGQNVISQDQADAITQGLTDKATQLQTQMQQRRQLIQGFIADGVITQAEIDQLPADDPLRQAFDSIAQDGQMSVDQLHLLGPGFGGRGPGFGHGRGFGPGMGGPWDSDPSTAPGSGSSTGASL